MNLQMMIFLSILKMILKFYLEEKSITIDHSKVINILFGTFISYLFHLAYIIFCIILLRGSSLKRHNFNLSLLILSLLIIKFLFNVYLTRI